nr:MAG TPA: hypothetical protein [Caudoviricetes sp.]DAO43184.1 MAG TPA: hypothetical protein [Caudoviricetes sp.]
MLLRNSSNISSIIVFKVFNFIMHYLLNIPITHFKAFLDTLCYI